MSNWRDFIRSFSLLTIILFAVLTLVASGGGGDDNGKSPVITNLEMYPGSHTSLLVSLEFQDADGDISTITNSIYDENYSLLFNKTSEVSGASGIKNGGLSGEFDFSYGETGDYSIEFYFTDKKGNNSNIISGDFRIEGGFGNAVSYTDGDNNFYLGDTAIGDLNGDGLNDVAAIQIDPPINDENGPLSIYYQMASGGIFESPETIDLGIRIRGVAIADINSDNKADLIISGQTGNIQDGYSGQVIIMHQDPDSGQLGPQEYTLNMETAGEIAVGDLDGDGRNDLAVQIDDGIALFYQNDDGMLSPEVDINASPFGYDCFYIADMNNDGRNDFIVQSSRTGVNIIKQLSSGEFSTVPDVYSLPGTVGFDFYYYAVGDLNGDHLTDLAMFFNGDADGDIAHNIYIFLQNAQGTLNSPNEYPAYWWFYGATIIDITKDGLNDIILVESGSLKVLRQTDDHTFSSSSESETYGFSSTSSFGDKPISIGDVTGDGRLDAVLTNQGTGLYVIPYRNNVYVPWE